jgi:hypothetical protein
LQRVFYEAKQYLDRVSDWNRKFDEFTEQPRSKLLKALQEHRLLATGKKFPLPTIKDSVALMINESESIVPKIDRELIPSDFWGSADIDWRESFVEGLTKECAVAYGLILIDVAELLKEFPLPNGEPYGGVSKVGDYLFLTSTDEIRSGARLGRPPYKWDEFHLEMTERTMGGLPSKMEACVAEMEAWCQKKWNQPVGRSTVFQKIKPYYDKFLRKSET